MSKLRNEIEQAIATITGNGAVTHWPSDFVVAIERDTASIRIQGRLGDGAQEDVRLFESPLLTALFRRIVNREDEHHDVQEKEKEEENKEEEKEENNKIEHDDVREEETVNDERDEIDRDDEREKETVKEEQDEIEKVEVVDEHIDGDDTEHHEV